MRIFELIYTMSLFLLLLFIFVKEINLNFLVNYRYVTCGISVITVLFGGLAICFGGYRFIMLPLYLIGLTLCLMEAFGLIKRYNAKSIHKEEQMLTKKKLWMLRRFGIIVTCLLFILAILLVMYVPIKDLPQPSGNNKVGTVIMDFTNSSRMDILTGTTKSQTIAAQVWYPTLDTKEKRRINWMDRKVASLFAQREGLPDIFGQFSMIKTNSYLNAPISTAKEKYPVILFSGGGGMFRGQNVIQMEELASHGFIVVAVSHPLDDFATVYSDGTVLGYDNQLSDVINQDLSQAISYMKDTYKSEDATPEMQRTTIRQAKLSNLEAKVWAQDLIFIANQLEKMNDGSIESSFLDKMDTSQFGVFGHSLGGAAAGQTCLMDNRFKAFVNMDGTPFGDSVDQIINQPFMVLETGMNSGIKFRASEGYASKQTNYFIVNVEGAEHMNFTDYNTAIPKIGKSFGLLGNINTNRQTKITNTYLLAFFNQYLKGYDEPLLSSTKSPFSEVRVSQR